ncbi:MAG: hypothetical protein ACI4EV_00440 [Lachnospiraceae bacterium]
MKQCKRIMALLLSILLILQIPGTAFAAEENTPKEEVVYINLNQDGSVNEIYVVNIFDLDENGQIIDYGKYDTLRNMTTSDKIGYSDNKITIDTSAGKLYYEGKFSSNAIPWDISIHYYMDGTEYTAKEIAGKSGTFRLKMSIRKNARCYSTFFEGYALQATIVLDTQNCKDIMAENATVANVGRNKQLTYTILPNTESDIEITAKVNDFKMDGITINGIRLNMNIETDDSQVHSKTDEIIAAVNELDKGALSLYKGASSLYDGTKKLASGAGTLSEKAGTLSNATALLNEKTAELYTGVGNLSFGANTLYSGLAALDTKSSDLTNGALATYFSLCTSAQTQLNTLLRAYGMSEVTLTPDNYDTVLTNILNKLSGDAAAQVTVLKEQLDSYNTFYQGLLEYTLAVSNASLGANSLQSGLNTLYTNTATLKLSMGELATGTSQLSNGISELNNGIVEINNGAANLNNGAKELSCGTGKFVDEASKMSDEISSQIDSLISSVSGNNAETVSFVSKQNTNIKSVQFVMKTDAIQTEEVETVEAETEEKLNFWQKLLRLFGLY